MDTATYRLHIKVNGRVQNVGFRAFVQQAGSRLKLCGWVRNVGDHQVETIAEGGKQDLEAFASLVKTGPYGSRVEEYDVRWENATGEYRDFSVRPSS